jgi:F-type H+-transporting ATPase subunit delta
MAEVFEVESRAGDEGSAERRVARVYAEALLTAANQKSQAEEIGQELNSVVGILQQNPAISQALGSPIVKRAKKAPVIDKAFKGNVSELLFNFVNVLNEKDRLSLLRHIALAYREHYDEQVKRVRVVVKSAVALTDSQMESLKNVVSKATGLEPVLEAKIDKSLLGGMIVQIKDQVFDGSVRTRIENIRNQLLARSSYEIQVGRDRFSTAG